MSIKFGLHKLTGEPVGAIESTNSAVPGRDLVSCARQLLGQPCGIVKLAFGATILDEEYMLSEQAMNAGAM